MVVTYCATGGSNQVQGLFPRSRVPYRSTIIRNVGKYLEYGVSTNRQNDVSGRRRTVRSIENIQEVPALQDDSNVTAHRNNCPNISKIPFNRITKIDPRWHPYRMQICRYAISCVKEMRKDESRTANGCWESLKHLCPDNNWRWGYISAKRECLYNHIVVRYASRGDPAEDFVYDKPSSGEKLIVWIGLVRNNLIGPFFFDGNVNGQTYLEMLNNFVFATSWECLRCEPKRIHT